MDIIEEVCTLKCNHSYHKECIRHINQLTCPYCRAVIVEGDVSDDIYFDIHGNVQEIMSEYEEEDRQAAMEIMNQDFIRPPPEMEIGMAIQFLREHIGIPVYFLPESITIHLPREQHHPPPPAGYYMNAVLHHVLESVNQDIYTEDAIEEENDGDFPFEGDSLRVLQEDSRIKLNFVALRD